MFLSILSIRTLPGVSWEYLKFLAKENRTDDWGKRLYEAWDKTGKCAPVVITEIEKSL